MSEKGQDLWTHLLMHQQHDHVPTHSITYKLILCQWTWDFRLTQQGAWAWGRV